MTTKLPRITNLILALFLTASLGDVEATDLKQELIKTDQQLNAIYKAITKKLSDKDKKALRKDQRAWIKQRDQECKTKGIKATGRQWLDTVNRNKTQTKCVVRLTQERVKALKVYTKTTTVTKKQYPPYPDLWGREMPSTKQSYYSIRITNPSKSGEACIVFFRKEKSRNLMNVKINQYVLNDIKNAFFQKENPLQQCFKPKKDTGYGKDDYFSLKANIKIQFNNGNTIRIRRQDENYCINPFVVYIEMINKAGKILKKKSALLKLDKPYEELLAKNCDYGEVGDSLAKIRIKSVYGYLILLKDQTFLFYYPRGNFFIRFDKNFETKFPINRNKVYIMDTDKLNKIMLELDKKYDIDAHLYIYDSVMKAIRQNH